MCTHVCLSACGVLADNPGLRPVLLCTAMYAKLANPGVSGGSLVSIIHLTVEVLELQMSTTASAFMWVLGI